MAKSVAKNKRNVIFIVSIVALLLVLYYLNNGTKFNMQTGAKFIKFFPKVTLSPSVIASPSPTPEVKGPSDKIKLPPPRY